MRVIVQQVGMVLIVKIPPITHAIAIHANICQHAKTEASILMNALVKSGTMAPNAKYPLQNVSVKIHVLLMECALVEVVLFISFMMACALMD